MKRKQKKEPESVNTLAPSSPGLPTRVEFLAQLYPGRNAVGFSGEIDGDAELRLLVPQQEKHHLAVVPFNFLCKKLKVTLEVT